MKLFILVLTISLSFLGSSFLSAKTSNPHKPQVQLACNCGYNYNETSNDGGSSS